MNPLTNVHLCATFYMVGLICYSHFTLYPLFAEVPTDRFSKFHHAYIKRTTGPIALPMVIEMVTALGLVFFNFIFALNLFLLILIWLVTFFWSVPQHNRLAQGFDQAAFKSLMRANIWRVGLWVTKGILFVAIIQTNLANFSFY